jgi:hypothetical protein
VQVERPANLAEAALGRIEALDGATSNTRVVGALLATKRWSAATSTWLSRDALLALRVEERRSRPEFPSSSFGPLAGAL